MSSRSPPDFARDATTPRGQDLARGSLGRCPSGARRLGVAALGGARARRLVPRRLTRVGAADDLSDWDTVVLSDRDCDDDELLSDYVNGALGIARPEADGPPSLALHVRFRRAAAVEVAVLGSTARAERERVSPVVWAYELRHALPLHVSAGVGETYRARVADAFSRQRPQLAGDAYRNFRQSRNEAVAALARPDEAAQIVAAAACVRYAARFWLLASGEPHPGDKWLLPALEHEPALVRTLRVAVDVRPSPSDRFDALWALWERIDEHAQDAGIDLRLLEGSPFRRPRAR